ncbi:MAG: hypothetical protein ACMUHB_07130 [Thermoplasmatota archaeon]
MNLSKIDKACSILMVLGLSIILFLPTLADGTEGTMSVPPTRAVDYATGYASGLGTHYIGSNGDFRIYISNLYSGEDWKGDAYTYLHDDIYFVKLSIMADKVKDAEDNVRSTLITPLEAGSLTPYNGPANQGYNISSSRYYYTNEFNDDFSFFVQAQGSKEGYYYLPIQIVGRVQIDFSSTDPSGFVWKTFTVNMDLTFFVQSYVNGASDTMELRGYEDSYCPIYAGAEYLTLLYSSISPQSVDLDNFDIELNVPSEHFTIENPNIHMEELSYTRALIWKADISPFTPPGRYMGGIYFRYYIDELFIYDGPYKITIQVAPTPLLIGPDTKDMTVPTITIQQGYTEEAISVKFTNEGNVPMVSGKVRLDLDSAKFLQQKQFYYNEEYNAMKVYPPLEFDIGELAEGESVTASFPAIAIEKMLPPGDYLIPFDYIITYVDPSDESGSTIRESSYQWDELGIEDYMEIMWFRQDPRPLDLKRPHIMIRIVDPDAMPEYEMKMDTVLHTGEKGRYVDFQVTNKEFYTITDATIRIWSSDPEKVWNKDSPAGPGLLASLEEIDLPGRDLDLFSPILLGSSLEISEMAGTGLFEVFVEVTGFDDGLKVVEGNRSFFIQIKAEPGCLDIAGISTSSVEPGEDFDLMITLINSGDLAVEDFQIMVSCHDNMISVIEPTQSGINVGPGETATLQYRCRASECMDYEKVSELFILTKTKDSEGNQMDFTDNEPQSINIMAAREPEELHTTNAIRTSAMYFFLALFFSTLLISLTVVISITLFLKAKYRKIFGPMSAVKGDKDINLKNEDKKGESTIGSGDTVQKNDVDSGPLSPMQRGPVSMTPVPGPGAPAVRPAFPQNEQKPMAGPTQYQQVQPVRNDELSGVFDPESKIDDLFEA